MTLDDFLARLDVRKSGSGWVTKCPAHDDRQASLSIKEGEDGRVLLKCHAGCPTEGIVAGLDLTMADLFPEKPNKPRPAAASGRETVYPIRDTGGVLIAEHHRIDVENGEKRVWWSRNGKNGLGGLPLEDLPLYGSERIKDLDTTKPFYITEGEKACDASTHAGLQALATVTGAAGMPSAKMLAVLRGLDVILWPDFDEPGRGHMQRLAVALHGVALRVRVLAWGERERDDAFDFFARGGKAEGVEKLANEAAEWEPFKIGSLTGILDDLVIFVRRFVVLLDAQASVLAVWIAHTHAIEAAEATPYLAITSAEKQSGKTRLLEVLALLVRKALQAICASEAAIFRSIEKDTPTLLLDEVDSIFGRKAKDNEPMRAILNAGNRRGSYVLRVEGEKAKEVARFQVFCPRALAGIGRLPDTIADRSFPIRLKRRAPSEAVDRFRSREAEPIAEVLRARLVAWAGSAVPQLMDARPDLPHDISDRQAEAAEPLLAIADLAGGEWPKRLREAIGDLCGQQEASEDSAGLRLLSDTRAIFDGVERLSSADLCGRLNALEESGWAGWHEGKGISVMDLARLLRPYEIRPGKHRAGQETFRGYRREDLAEAWTRWLTIPPSPGNREQAEQAEQFNVYGPIGTALVPGVPGVPGSGRGDGNRGEIGLDDGEANAADVGAL